MNNKNSNWYEGLRNELFKNSFSLKLQLIEELKMASENFQQTGLHASHNEVKGWLSDLASGKVGEKPICHK